MECSHVIVNTYLKTSASTQFVSSLPLLLAGLSKTTIKAFSNRRLSFQKTWIHWSSWSIDVNIATNDRGKAAINSHTSLSLYILFKEGTSSLASINSVGFYSFQTGIFQLFTYIFPKNRPLQRPLLFSCPFPIIPFGLYASADLAFFFFAKRTFLKVLNFSRRFQINNIFSRQHQSFSGSLLQSNDKLV